MTLDASREIVLWGSTQVGKTTALVAYLANHASWVCDDDASRDALWQRRYEWNQLKQNQLVAGTAETVWSSLRHRDGAEIRFRDIRGVDAIGNRDEATALRKSAGTLLFLEWPSHRNVVNEIAVQNALAQLPHSTPRALVITKCESRMTPQQFASCVIEPKAFAATHAPAALCRLFDAFEANAIFPITVYGWKDDLPAQYYNEFGQFVPWAIEPAMVQLPFDYIVNKATRGSLA